MKTELLNDMAFSLPLSSVAAGTSQQTGTAVDMSGADLNAQEGFDAVCFVCVLNTVVDGCVLSIAAKEADDSGLSTNVNTVTGSTSATFTASGSSNTLLVCDVVRPKQRYVAPVINRTTQNATIGGVIAIRYRARKLGITQLAASVLTSKLSTPEV